MMRPAIKLGWIVPALVAIGLSNLIRAETPRVLSKEQRIARNYELAKSMYNAYVKLPEVGYPDTWKAKDYAAKVTYSNFLFVPPKNKTHGLGNATLKTEDRQRRWYTWQQDKPMDFKDEDVSEYTTLLKVYPDLRAIGPFKGFCDENGCAFQIFCGGHDARDHKYYEFDEIAFIWTDEYGKLTRVEAFEDWVNEKPFMIRAGLASDIPSEK